MRCLSSTGARLVSVSSPVSSSAAGSCGGSVISPSAGLRIVRWLQRQVCGLHGHDSMLTFAGTKMALICVSCGHQSPGIDVGQPRVRRCSPVTPPKPIARRSLRPFKRVAAR
jgi:hypothetical protein